uniref:Probable protein E5 n=1 Tax=Macaca mulata papillomavirus 1 TaxID=2779844 RepID=VE5_MMPV1|nr:RecName: Full=Probable protein E5 [Macaca mulata papillomavirus 1]
MVVCIGTQWSHFKPVHTLNSIQVLCKANCCCYACKPPPFCCFWLCFCCCFCLALCFVHLLSRCFCVFPVCLSVAAYAVVLGVHSEPVCSFWSVFVLFFNPVAFDTPACPQCGLQQNDVNTAHRHVIISYFAIVAVNIYFVLALLVGAAFKATSRART